MGQEKGDNWQSMTEQIPELVGVKDHFGDMSQRPKELDIQTVGLKVTNNYVASCYT